ncbi:hypothetical protein [Clostridium massiliamazoniense]|uniref:hypothetical protein n=1 Tax=Clostridium massiliamazoniense TaxID=1347366 RepID=UPI0006D7D817|nr:hypothetical protein [Clostridium massiliamazoniense]
MVIRIKKLYIVIFLLILLGVGGAIFYFTRGNKINFGRNLNNKSTFYKEVVSENVEQISDEELEKSAFSIVEKLDLDLGEPIDIANKKSTFGNGYNYDLIFSRGNVQLNENTGELVSIAVETTVKDGDAVLTEEELINKACEYYNILDCPSSYEIRKNESLGDDYYNVVWEKQYDGDLYSKYESVNMVLNKKDGTISKITINNLPNVADKDKEIIEKKEAEKSISSFKELKGFNYSGEMEKQIVVPNTNYISDDYESASYATTAWVAKLKNDAGEEAFVYIDGLNGEIIGGN